MPPTRALAAVVALCLISGASVLAAQPIADDALESGAKLCTDPMPGSEKTYGIPHDMLRAIATVEAGQRHKTRNVTLPWPWTINARGRGYYLATKEEAIAKARQLKRRHVRNMAVGCMQINISANKHAFASLEDAFDPAKNVAYAASVLKDGFEDEGSWKKAVAAYHTGDSETGGAYARKVYKVRARLMEAGRKHAHEK